MGSRKIIMLIGSILVGVVAGAAILSYLNSVEEDVAQASAKVEVFVVARDIPAGTPAFEVEQSGAIEIREIVSEIRPATSLTDLAQIQGLVAANNLAQNQVLVSGMFLPPEVTETTFSDLLTEGLVATTLNISKSNAVAGFIEPGDFVDVVVRTSALSATLGDQDAFDTTAQQTPYDRPARTLYRGVRVIAVGTDIVGAAEDTQLPDGEAPVETDSYTIAVPADAAQKILSVSENNIVLTLLPDNWDPEAQPNQVLTEILTDAALPGEDGSQVTPYGRDGFVDLFEDLDGEG